MVVSREDVFSYLFDLTANVTWLAVDSTPTTFITRSRRVKLFNEVPAEEQPALFQAEHDESVDQVSNLPYKQVWGATWLIYQCVAKNPDGIGATENNKILDALQARLAPRPADPGFSSRRNTLMGRVYHCYISGEVFKDPGDIDDQGMMAIPIKILVP